MPLGASQGVANRREREICQDGIASGLLRQIKPWPTAPGADIEKPRPGAKAETFCQVIRLGDSTVTVDAGVGAPYLSLDEQICS